MVMTNTPSGFAGLAALSTAFLVACGLGNGGVEAHAAGMKEGMRVGKGRNVLGGPLEVCGMVPRTGFFRTGCCETGPDDLGRHLVCAEVTAEFLEFSRRAGNDLMTPRPEYGFPGLSPGDRWCLCAGRWLEAAEAGVAPPVVLGACHEAALEVVRLELLMRHASDGGTAE
jgi:uncharacterized protein (DUF2237 family)